MTELETIVQLSHAFGGPDYVRGGGGNTSVKNDTTLWVKPSGTTLADMRVETFVAVDRARIDDLFGVEPPSEPAAREELVKNMMAAAVSNNARRPSVEAPLHNVLDAAYVVHTHPALVNGLSCAVDGQDACARLFPDALWIEYIDPGYTLCMTARERIQQYRQAHGEQPALLLLQNHGIFIAADTADMLHELYARVMDTLRAEYEKADISMDLDVHDAPGETCDATIRQLFGEDATGIASSGMFAYLPGPISPDHLVYAKAFPFAGDLTAEAVAAYRAQRGYAPKVVVTGDRVYGIGTSQKNADLALEFAQDGALVMHLANAFGGTRYMTDTQREFIENWEVESYRAKQV